MGGEGVFSQSFPNRRKACVHPRADKIPGNGDKDALNQLIPLIYGELHRLAGRYMRNENVAHTLQTTAPGNEACCKVVSTRTTERQWRKAKAGLQQEVHR